MTFAGHQTFHIREGWLYKGMAAIKTDEENGQPPTIFLDKDAPERLGIGRNMVTALRFWMQATGLAEEKLENRYSVQRLTKFGELIWNRDRYLENEGTWWLIHYQLASSKDLATTWYWFYNYYAPVTFDEASFLDSLSQWVVSYQPDKPVAQSSLKKDVDCFLKTYLPDKYARTPEDLIVSPLANLKIITPNDDERQKRFRFERLLSSNLSPLLFLFVLIDRQKRMHNGQNQVRLLQALKEPMNVGRIFNITTTSMGDLLAGLKNRYPDWEVKFTRTAGLDQLTLPDISQENILEQYYQEQAFVSRIA